MKIQESQVIKVQAYKHNGKLYRQWNGVKVIRNSKKLLVLLMYKTKVSEDKGQNWTIREPKIWFFPLEKIFFNTVVLVRKAGFFYYTNIASPPIFEDGIIKFIDYDVDIKAYPQQKIKIVDKKEYDNHKKEFNYSKDLIQKVDHSIENVMERIKKRRSYFNFRVIKRYLRIFVESKDLSTKFLKINNKQNNKTKKS